MKLGLITDIHEHVDYLRIALARLAQEQVEQVVVMGDLFSMGERIEETCRLLAEAQAVGVWGNHDFGLCFEPEAETQALFPPAVVAYMTTLGPRLDLGGCHFTHVEPWLDPENVLDLNYYEGLPDDHHKLARVFNATSNRIMFAGHYHRWLLATPEGIGDWQGIEPIMLTPGRYFVVIGALCEGRYATYNTETSELRPYNE